MQQQYDVLVIGGGIVGLTAALAMAKRQRTVAVLEAGNLQIDSSKMDLRVYAINQASQTLLTELGVWQLLDNARIAPYNKMHVWDAANAAHIDFDSRCVAKKYLGHIIEESVLKTTLLAQVQAHTHISLFTNTIIDKVETASDCARVFSQDRVWEGRLLMAADGANSPTRQKLSVPLTSWSYNQTAIVAMITTEKPHQQTAYQVFEADGPLAFLPLINSHQCSIVWSTSPQRAKHLLELDEASFNTEITQVFANKLGSVQVESARHHFPLQMRHVNQYSGVRWLLLGDAAHTIHPLAGLGLNLGLADVRAWMNILDAMPAKDFSNRQLRSYQRQRKHAVWQTIMLMEGFKRIFSQTAAPIRSIRGLGLSFCNSLKPLKRLFIEHAAG